MVLVLGRVNQECHELSIRQAMGAGMVALRQLELAESVLLTTVAALGGIAIAWQGTALVNGYLAGLSPHIMLVELDAGLAATVAVSILIVSGMFRGSRVALVARRRLRRLAKQRHRTQT